MHSFDVPTAIVVAGAMLLLWVSWSLVVRQRRRGFISAVDQATYSTLHQASLAARHLSGGLTPEASDRAGKHLLSLLGAQSLAISDHAGVLSWTGPGDHHAETTARLADTTLHNGRTTVADYDEVSCRDPNCVLAAAVSAPILSGDHVIGAITAFTDHASAGLTRATEEVAQWFSAQLELAEVSKDRTRVMEAELRALRAQISPHFIYNSLAAIASFVRTDPARARELLLEFADFTRYALRRGGTFTTLQEELRNVERYLVLEQARFGERLRVSLLIAPEVLPVKVPYLAIQPLVENAVRHGLAGKEGVGHVTITASDRGHLAEITIEDDGIGSDPHTIQRVLDDTHESGSIGLGNVDARLRQVYGDDSGLVVETAEGAGTKVSFRIPKFAPDVVDAD